MIITVLVNKVLKICVAEINGLSHIKRKRKLRLKAIDQTSEIALRGLIINPCFFGFMIYPILNVVCLFFL